MTNFTFLCPTILNMEKNKIKKTQLPIQMDRHLWVTSYNRYHLHQESKIRFLQFENEKQRYPNSLLMIWRTNMAYIQNYDNDTINKWNARRDIYLDYGEKMNITKISQNSKLLP